MTKLCYCYFHHISHTCNLFLPILYIHLLSISIHLLFISAANITGGHYIGFDSRIKIFAYVQCENLVGIFAPKPSCLWKLKVFSIFPEIFICNVHICVFESSWTLALDGSAVKATGGNCAWMKVFTIIFLFVHNCMGTKHTCIFIKCDFMCECVFFHRFALSSFIGKINATWSFRRCNRPLLFVPRIQLKCFFLSSVYWIKMRLQMKWYTICPTTEEYNFYGAIFAYFMDNINNGVPDVFTRFADYGSMWSW